MTEIEHDGKRIYATWTRLGPMLYHVELVYNYSTYSFNSFCPPTEKYLDVLQRFGRIKLVPKIPNVILELRSERCVPRDVVLSPTNSLHEFVHINRKLLVGLIDKVNKLESEVDRLRLSSDKKEMHASD